MQRWKDYEEGIDRIKSLGPNIERLNDGVPFLRTAEEVNTVAAGGVAEGGVAAGGVAAGRLIALVGLSYVVAKRAEASANEFHVDLVPLI